MVGEPDFAMIPVGQADYATAIELVQNTMRPASDLALSEALAVLEVSTVRGRESEDKAMLGDAVYIRTLQGYPHDVALSAINDMVMTCKFAPALSELVERCEKLVQPRRNLLASLMWSKGKTFEAPKPAEQISGKTWQEAPDYGNAQPAMPIRDKADMAKQLREMGQA